MTAPSYKITNSINIRLKYYNPVFTKLNDLVWDQG